MGLPKVQASDKKLWDVNGSKATIQEEITTTPYSSNGSLYYRLTQIGINNGVHLTDVVFRYINSVLLAIVNDKYSQVIKY